MPRLAREYLETSFFHVMVQGINKEYIFNNERYINRYMKLIHKNLQNGNLKIIAFCIMNNHAHLLINVDKISNLSKFMQKINGAYAKYYNYMENERVGYVFRDRYKSEPILDKMQLIQCIKYIHQNPVKAKMVNNVWDYKYSSYNYYKQILNKMKDNQIYINFTKEEMRLICNSYFENNKIFLDTEINIETIIDDAITEFINKENIKVFEIFQKDDILKKLIKYLKNNKKIKYVDIMKKLEITKGTMERLKK